MRQSAQFDRRTAPHSNAAGSTHGLGRGEFAVLLALALAACGEGAPADSSPAKTTVATACDPCPGAAATSVFGSPGTETCWCVRPSTQVDRCTSCGPNGCAPTLAFALDPAIYSCATVQAIWANFCGHNLPCCSLLHGDGTHAGDVIACACDSAC